MSKYHFGVGYGRVSGNEISRRKRIARKHDAEFTYEHGNSGHCTCGHGCALDTCPNLHYWYSAESYGSPFDEDTAAAVLREIGSR